MFETPTRSAAFGADAWTLPYCWQDSELVHMLQMVHGLQYPGPTGGRLTLQQCFESFHQVMDRLRAQAARIAPDGRRYDLR